MRVTSGDGYSSSRTQFLQQQQLTCVEKNHQPRMVKSRTSLDMVVSSNVSKGFSKRPTTTTTLSESRASSATNMFDLQRSKSSGSRLVDSQRNDDVANLLDESGSSSKMIQESVYMNVSAELIPSLNMFPDASSRLLLAKLTIGMYILLLDALISTLYLKLKNIKNKLSSVPLVLHFFLNAIDPDGASSRMVMDGVKVLFDQAVKCSRFTAPIARFCFHIIEVRHVSYTYLSYIVKLLRVYKHTQILYTLSYFNWIQ